MRQHLRAFLDYLRLNRNASRHTVLAYRGDLTQFVSFVEAREVDRRVGPHDLTHQTVRKFLAELYRDGIEASTASRKLAAIRSFARYLRREGILDHDPGSLIASPRLARKIPAHLDINEVGAPARRARCQHAARTARSSDSRALLRIRAAAERACRDRRRGRQLEQSHAASPREGGKGADRAVQPHSGRVDSPISSGSRAAHRVGRRESRPQHRILAVCELSRRATVDPERRPPRPALCGSVEHAIGDQSARASALVRDSPSRARS